MLTPYVVESLADVAALKDELVAAAEQIGATPNG